MAKSYSAEELDALAGIAPIEPDLAGYTDADLDAMEAEGGEYDSPLLAGAAGIARGATLGLSDAAGAALGGSEYLDNLKKYNPTASTVGEVAGAVGSTVYGAGPASLLARGAQRAVAKSILGSGVKAGIARAGLAAGLEGAGAGLGQTISEVALAQKNYTPEQVGEKLIANVGMGFLLGGSLGAGMGATGAAFKGIKNAIRKPTAAIVEGAETLGDDIAKVADDFIPDGDKYGGRSTLNQAIPNADDAAIALQELGLDVEPAKQLIKNESDSIIRSVGDGDTLTARYVNADKTKFQNEVISKLDDQLKAQTTLSEADVGNAWIEETKDYLSNLRETNQATFGGAKKDLQKLKLSDSDNVYGLRVLRGTEPYKNAGLTSSPVRRKARELERLFSKKAFVTADMLESEIRAVGGEARAAAMTNPELAFQYGQLKKALERTQDRVIMSNGLKATGGDKIAAREFVNTFKTGKRNYAKEIQKITEIGDISGKKIKNIAQFEAFLEKSNPETIGKQLLERNLKNPDNLLDLFEKFPEQAENMRKKYVFKLWKGSGKEGEFNLAKFIEKANNMPQRSMDILFTPEGARTIRNLDKVNRFKSGILKTPKQMQSSFPGSFLQMGDRIASELKDVAFLAVSRALGYLDDGAARASDIGNKTLIAKPQVGGAVRKIETGIKKSVQRFIDGGSKLQKGLPQGAVQGVLGTKEDNKKRMDTFAMYAANPQTFINKVTENTAGIEQYSPETAQAMMNTAMETVSFLTEKMPKKDGGLDEDLFGIVPDYSDYEMAKFNRYARAVENPLSILDDIENGTLTPEAIESVSTIYPSILEEIQTQVMDDLAAKKPRLQYGQKIQLSMLLGFPVSDTMKPEFISAMQRTPDEMAATGMNGQTLQTRQNAGLNKISSNYETQIQRVTKG